MDFRRIWILPVVLSMFACGQRPAEEEDKDDEEETIRFYSQASDASIRFGENQFFLDVNIDHILQFSAKPLALKDYWKLPFGGRQWFLAQGDGKYFVTVGRDHFGIVGTGVRVLDPVAVDKIEAVAFSSEHNHLVVFDERGDIAVLILSEDGKVNKTFSGTPNFGTNDALVSAVMLNDGRLLASLGEKTLAIVDLVASVNDEDWVLETFDVDGNGGFAGATSMTWLGALPEADNLVLIKDADRLILENLTSQEIVDELDLTARSSIKAFRESRPHFLASDNLSEDDEKFPIQVMYVDEEEIVSKTFVGANYYDSYLLTDLDSVVLVDKKEKAKDDEDETENSASENAFIQGTVYRYNLSKGTLADKFKISDKVRLGIMDDYLLKLYDSPLGFLERKTFGDEKAEAELKSFNLPILKNKYD